MSDKKIAIITYHGAINYGAVLQAYALNHSIHKLGYECDTIDYYSDAIDVQYRMKKYSESFSVLNFFAHNLASILHMHRKAKFRDFIKEYITLTNRCTKDNIMKIASGYDVYITGSDQVFNPTCNNNDSVFFLDFVTEGTKNSYAASLGAITKFELAQINTVDLLRDFSNISLREKTAAEYLSKKLDRNCYHVIDPVFLLSEQDWSKLIPVTNKKKPYIFVYNQLDFKYMMDFAKRLSSEKNIPVYVINRTSIGEFQYFGWSKSYYNASPLDFLELISNAEFVITDSFHATAFSIIFQRKFFSFCNRKCENTNSRIESILNLTGLEGRIVYDDNVNTNEEINYVLVKKRLSQEVQKSKNFLLKICNE